MPRLKLKQSVKFVGTTTGRWKGSKPNVTTIPKSKPKSKYVYIVTRFVRGTDENTVDIPNLGVHTTLKSAVRHFESILKDRVLLGAKVIWDRPGLGPIFADEVNLTAREAFISYEKARVDKNKTERLMLEKWKVKCGEKSKGR